MPPSASKGRAGLPIAPALAVLAAASCGGQAPPSETALAFEERTGPLNLARTGPSYASAAADFDRDGWPDLAVSEHRQVALHRNEAGEGFARVPEERLAPRRDAHGVSWLDWNADGWPDLYVSHGAFRGRGKRTDSLHLNGEGRAFERTELEGVLGNARGRGRSATPWDLNSDGRLDLLIVNFYVEERPQRLALSGPGGYCDAARELGFHDLQADTVTAFRLDGETAFVLSGLGRDAGHVFRRDDSGRFVDVTEKLGIEPVWTNTVPAVAVGDVDNDGDDDLYFAHAPVGHQGARQDEGSLEFFYAQRLGAERAGFTFRTEGAFFLETWAEGRRRHEHLHLGPDARVAEANRVRVEPRDATLAGAPPLATAPPGIYFWRKAPGVYRLRYVAGEDRPNAVTGRVVDAEGPLELQEQVGEKFLDLEARNRLLVNEGGRFRRVDVASDPGAAQDARFVDFDNDGDLDLFVVNGAHKLRNGPDRLYENRGNLAFVDVTDLAGVAGSRFGRGATSTALDYDRDGRMDLFVANGYGPPPRNREGPQEFFRNVSKAGNWLRVKLAPTESNPMALGATVVVETSGNRQTRFVNAATGTMATSWLPLHFGLGEAESAEVIVHWPSGRTQRRTLEANARVTLEEPSQISAKETTDS